MRQKHYWEIRIRELGGSDYHTLRKQIADVGKLLFHSSLFFFYISNFLIFS